MSDENAIPRYAQALFNAALKKKELKKVEEDLKDFCDVLGPSGLKSYLENPRFNTEQKKKVIERVGKALGSKLTVPFLQLLIRKVRLNLLYGISRHFSRLLLDHQNIVPVDVTLRSAPHDALKEKIIKSVGRMVQKKVQVTFHENTKLVGGIRIRMGNYLIDGTVRSRLQELKHKLLQTSLN
jgi:F-type H+-transporting ATPase subunit delta